MNIKPQDRRSPRPIQISLPAALCDRLTRFATELKDQHGESSSEEYVVCALLDANLPELPSANGNGKKRGRKAVKG